MSYRCVDEQEFNQVVRKKLDAGGFKQFGCVTGPGRSGAIAAVYVSHRLRIPFIPFGARVPPQLWPVLVVDTATWTGRTLRKAVRNYTYANAAPLVFYQESPGAMVKFWYEKLRLDNVD